MHWSLQPPINTTQYFVSGDVVIDESAIIAPGVIIQADIDYQVVVGPGVCVGMGAILHAHQGNIVIEAGATLGAGVLAVGEVIIKANACIGACSTLISCAIESEQVLPAGSLLGNTGPVVSLTLNNQPPTPPPETPVTPVAEDKPEDKTIKPPLLELPPSNPEPAPENTSDTDQKNYSQQHLNRLMGTLFPHRNYFFRSSQNGSPQDS